MFVPDGDFLRGRSHSLPDDGLVWFPNLRKDSRPGGQVSVDPFYLDKHETTNLEFAKFLAVSGGRAPYYWPGREPPVGKENRPTVNIAWAEAQAYCDWTGKRLCRPKPSGNARRGG